MGRRAAELAVEGALLRAAVGSVDETLVQALEDRGYRLIRHSLRMEIELDRPPPRPVWPEGIVVRTFENGDARAVYEAQEEAFADHREYVPEPYDEWAHGMLGRPDFDRSLWFLAWDGADLAGFALCAPHEWGQPELGWVDSLGVRRPWRRRGLGLALLLHCLGEFRHRGKPAVGLGVDAENLTGAVRLYERAGMKVVRRYDIYEKELRAGSL